MSDCDPDHENYILCIISPDCLTPTISNGNLVGDLTEGGTAAVLCATGYLGGGAATCAGGAWTVLPTCTARGKRL